MTRSMTQFSTFYSTVRKYAKHAKSVMIVMLTVTINKELFGITRGGIDFNFSPGKCQTKWAI